MAGADYISCRRCGTKVVYDGDWNGRDRLLALWDTTDVLCPDCIDKYEKTVAKAMQCMRSGKWKLAKKVLGNLEREYKE